MPDKNGGDQHGPGDRDPIGGRQIARRAEQEDEHDHGNHQRPVDEGDVDLPHLPVRRMLDMHARQIAELDRLLRDREGAGNDRLRRDDGRGHGKEDQRQRRPLRGHPDQRVVERVRRRQQHGALPEVVEQQRRPDQQVPRDPDRYASEMTHVGIERLGAGDGQDDGAQRQHAVAALLHEEHDGVMRAERPQDRRVLEDVLDAEHRQHDEPQDHHRPEQGAHQRRTGALDGEQQDQDRDGQRNDHVPELGRRHLKPLDRRQDRDSGRDHAVAVEQRRRREAERSHDQRPA